MHLIIIGVLVFLLLVDFGLDTTITYLDTQTNTVVEHEPFVVSDDAAELHRQLNIVDLHADPLLWNRDLTKRAGRGHVDLVRLREGRVGLQVLSAVTKSPRGQNFEKNQADAPDNITLLAIGSLWPISSWFSIYERAVYQAERYIDLANDNPDETTLIKTRGDLEALLSERGDGSEKIGVLLALEGAHPFEGEISKAHELYDLGYRIMGITHFFDNELGGSLHGTSGEGLTEFGKKAVREMDAKGMIIDIAHASPAAVDDILKIVSRPVILSHGGVKKDCDSPRNLSDEQMRRVAAKGGLLGVSFFEPAVCDISVPGVVRAIRAAVEVMGVDQVALGSDFDGAVQTAIDASEYVALVDEMLRQGFTAYEIQKITSENGLQFFQKHLPQN